jgi:hypothetical protein
MLSSGDLYHGGRINAVQPRCNALGCRCEGHGVGSPVIGHVKLLLPIGEHPLLFYQGGSPKAYVRVTIRSRHDRAKIYTQTGMLWNKTSAEGTAEVMAKKAMYKIRN